MKRIALFAAALCLGASFMLTGCGDDVKIDGKTDETYETSKTKMLESVSGDKKTQLEEAFDKIENRRKGPDAPSPRLDIDGMTADEIIKKANQKK